MRNIFLGIFLCCSCHLMAQTASDDNLTMSSESDRLNEIIDIYHSFKDETKVKHLTQWPDLLPETVEANKNKLTDIINQLRLVDNARLSDSELINKEMLTLILEDELYNLEYESYLMPLSSEGGFLTSMVYATSSLRLEDKKSEDDYLKKLKTTPRFINEKKDLLARGLSENKGLPKVIIEKCLGILEQHLSTGASDLFLMNPLEDSVHKNEGLKITEEEIMPAFQSLHTYLKKEYLSECKDVVGIHHNEGGKEYYEQRVRYFTTLEMTPQEVFDVGQSEVKRIRAEMEQIIEDLNFEGNFSDFFEFLRTDPQFYAETPEELLRHAAWFSKKAEEILPRYFTHLPRLPFTVNPVPAAIAPNYTTGRYSGGNMENQRSGQYWVNTYDLPSRPIFVLPSLTLHEAVPGHHLQISIAQELKGLPKFRTNTYLSAFGEGWGLYSEYLGKEAGIYATAYQDFGRLTYEMWRACRLVVDPGMHYFGWTRDEAFEFMKTNTALSLHEIGTEINRYIGWPGQAVSYKIGELKIRELRKIAEKELGDKFDIRLFHDMLLKNGSIPLTTLERVVYQHISLSK